MQYPTTKQAGIPSRPKNSKDQGINERHNPMTATTPICLVNPKPKPVAKHYIETFACLQQVLEKCLEEVWAILRPGRPAVQAIQLAAARILPLGLQLH